MKFHKSFQCLRLNVVISAVLLGACSQPKSNTQSNPQPTSNIQSSQSKDFGLSHIYDEKIEILESNPVRQSDLLREITDWVPTGVNESSIEDESCEATNLREQMLTADEAQKSRLLKSFVERCQDQWRTKKYSPTGSLIHFSSVDYAFENNRNFTYLKIRLQNGKIVRGILGVKAGTEKRPLIIANCGITCKTGDRASQYLLMQLFDETPFHVLVLGNGTTKQYYQDNGVGGFGGLTAAENVMRLARYFNNPNTPLNSRISNVHAFGVSLGSHESLYASLLNTNHEKIYGTRPIKSFAASCPVLDYPGTAVKLFSGRLARLAKMQLGGIFELFSTNLPLNPDEMKLESNDSAYPPFLAFSEKLYLQNQIATQDKFSSQDATWSLKPVYDLPTLLETSRLQNFLPQVQDPMFLWASKDDPVVDPYQNTIQLDENMPESMLDFVSTTITETGSHCAVPVSYGWKNASLVFQSHYLSRDPEFTSRLRRHRIEVDSSAAQQVEKWLSDEKNFTAKWTIKAGDNYARLKLTSTKRNHNRNCKNRNQGEDCYNSYNLRLPLSKFPGFLQKPINDAEAQGITRWLNVQVQALDNDGIDINRSKKAPAFFDYLEL